MEKSNNLDRILKIRSKVEQYNYIIEERKKSFEERQARQKEQFEKMQKVEKLQYKKEKDEMLGLKNKHLSQEKQFLSKSFFIKLGDLKEELMQHFGVEENDIDIKVTPVDTRYGEYSTEARVFMVKENPKYNGIIDVGISIKKLNIYYNMHYNMHYNMEQADGISFIDHCYSKNEWDVLDDTGMISTLIVDPNSFDDILVKIPYISLVLEARKDNSGAVPGISKHEYYWNTPLDAFATCITNCANKEKTKTLSKK